MTDAFPATSLPKIPGFRVDRRLGSGGTSTVYSACQLALNRQVAIKVFALDTGRSGTAAGRMNREAQLLARLDHENIVRCYDFGQADDVFYLVLELVDGESLRERLDRGGITEEDAVRITIGVAKGLRHAHSHRVIHRDVKPGNIFLARDGRIKLGDFGLARGAADVELTRSGITIGTPQYLSPEQARNPRQANESSDLYSLGATLYHMAAGRPPHDGESLAEVISRIVFHSPAPPETYNPKVSAALSQVITRLMARDVRARYHGVDELLSDLEPIARAFGTGEPPVRIKSVPSITWEAAQRRPRTRRGQAWLRGAMGGVAATVVVIGVVAALMKFGASKKGDASPERPVTPVFQTRRVVEGELSPHGALAALRREDQLEPKRETEALHRWLLAEVDRRAASSAKQGISAARRSLAKGDFDAAMRTYEAVVDVALGEALGLPVTEIDPEFVATVARARSSGRDVVDADVGAARAISERAQVDLLQQMVSESEELLRQHPPNFVEVERANDGARSAKWVGAMSTRFAQDIATYLSEFEATQWPPPGVEWRLAVEARVAENQRLIASRATRLAEEHLQIAIDAVRSFTLPEGEEILGLDREEVVDRVKKEAERQLGYDPSEWLARDESLSRELEATVARIDADISAERSRLLRRRSAAMAEELQTLLESRDYSAAARRVTEFDLETRRADPWGRLLSESVHELVLLESEVLSSLQADVGKEIPIEVGDGVQSSLQLEQVDVRKGELTFRGGRITSRVRELPVSEWIKRGGRRATPGLAALLRFLAGDLAEAETELRAVATDDGLDSLRRRVDEAIAAKRSAAQGVQERIGELLARFDQAVTADLVAEAASIATELLVAPIANDRAVRLRRKELQSAIDRNVARLASLKKRDQIVSSTAATVRFRDGIEVELEHDFKSQEELADFRLPGGEWRIRDGALTTLAPENRDLKTDWFVNRRGVQRALPFDPNHRVRVALDIEMPYEAAPPSRFALRLGTVCFGVLSLPSATGLQGQVNGWVGSIDGFDGHFFRPDLGEIRPRKRDAQEPRSFRLERGHRYLMVMDWIPGRENECTLRIDDELVCQVRGVESLEEIDWELRSETASSLGRLTASGSLKLAPGGGG